MTSASGRVLYDYYMSGQQSITINASDYLNGYGRYAFDAVASALLQQNVLTTSVTNFEPIVVVVNNYITDIDSPDYSDRALGYGTSSFRVSGQVVFSNGEPRFQGEIIPLNDNYDFVGGGSALVGVIRQVTGFLLDPLGQGTTVEMLYDGPGIQVDWGIYELQARSDYYHNITAEGRALFNDFDLNTASGFLSAINLVQHIGSNAQNFFSEYPEAGDTALTTAAFAFGGAGLLLRGAALLRYLSVGTNAFMNFPLLDEIAHNPNAYTFNQAEITENNVDHHTFSWSDVNGDPILYAEITSPVGPGGPTALEVVEYAQAFDENAPDWSSREFHFTGGTADDPFGENAGMTLSREVVNYDEFSIERTLAPGEDPENPASWETQYREAPRQIDPRLERLLRLQAIANDPDTLTGGQFGAVFGSSLGRSIAGDDIFVQIAASTVLGTALQNVGEVLGGLSAGATVTDAVDAAALNIGQDFADQFRAAGVGALATLLTAELGEAIGLDGNGFGDVLFSYAAKSSPARYSGVTAAFGNGSGYRVCTTKLRPQDWKSGNQLWVVEVIAPFGGVLPEASTKEQEMIKDLKAKVFPNEDIRYVALSKDGTKQVKVV